MTEGLLLITSLLSMMICLGKTQLSVMIDKSRLQCFYAKSLLLMLVSTFLITGCDEDRRWQVIVTDEYKYEKDDEVNSYIINLPFDREKSVEIFPWENKYHFVLDSTSYVSFRFLHKVWEDDLFDQYFDPDFRVRNNEDQDRTVSIGSDSCILSQTIDFGHTDIKYHTGGKSLTDAQLQKVREIFDEISIKKYTKPEYDLSKYQSYKQVDSMYGDIYFGGIYEVEGRQVFTFYGDPSINYLFAIWGLRDLKKQIQNGDIINVYHSPVSSSTNLPDEQYLWHRSTRYLAEGCGTGPRYDQPVCIYKGK